jgi:HD-like signal output (HDOD) protein
MAIVNLREKIQGIIHLPSLPAIAMEVISIIENPKTNVHTLSQLISKDQVLASKVLKIANSPFYGYAKTISTIDFAIVILGFETLKEVVMSISVTSHLSKNVSKDFDINSFWNHSIASSVTARELAKNIGYRILGEAFVAGLIHDLGLLILNQYFCKEFAEVVNLIKNDGLRLTEAEVKVYGVTHDEVGSWLAQRWNFPKQLIEAMRYHHNPGFASINKQLSAIIHYSEYLAQRIDSCQFEMEANIEYRPQYLELIKFKEGSMLEMFFEAHRANIETEVERIKSFIAM